MLLWRTVEKLKTERNIGNFTLPITDDHSPPDYVLDGQQRLTVIYSCLGAAEDGGGFAAGYDLDNEGFVVLPEKPWLSCLSATDPESDVPAARLPHLLHADPKKDQLQAWLDCIVKVFTGTACLWSRSRI